jgi:nucleoside-diphosphate-sugar epimerase
VHAASSPFRRTRQVDVEGTRLLLEAAKAAGVSHFMYISIVGIDRIPLPYYKHKLAAERLIEESGVPYSILRAPQFFTLMDDILRNLLRFPVGVYPAGFKFQPIDPGEVAERIVQQVAAGPGGRLAEIAGPEVRNAGELARAWLKASGKGCYAAAALKVGERSGRRRLPRGRQLRPGGKYGGVTWEDGWDASTAPAIAEAKERRHACSYHGDPRSLRRNAVNMVAQLLFEAVEAFKTATRRTR